MNGFARAVNLLPQSIRQAASEFSDAEEIRLRAGRRPSLLINGRERELNCPELDILDIQRIIEKMTGASLHTAANELAEGYLNCMGLRAGICGKAIIYNGELRGFKDFSSLAIRIPRECRGICAPFMEEIYLKGFRNTLLISGPGGGKTTALRELIRCLSDSGIRIGVVDERNELSASENGVFRFDLGSHSDVLVQMPKAAGAMMLLRGMNPEIIAMDEISTPSDLSAVSQIYGCGVGLLASAHAKNTDELYRRPLYKKLMAMEIFTYIVTISVLCGKRTYTAERI